MKFHKFSILKYCIIDFYAELWPFGMWDSSCELKSSGFIRISYFCALNYKVNHISYSSVQGSFYYAFSHVRFKLSRLSWSRLKSSVFLQISYFDGINYVKWTHLQVVGFRTNTVFSNTVFSNFSNSTLNFGHLAYAIQAVSSWLKSTGFLRISYFCALNYKVHIFRTVLYKVRSTLQWPKSKILSWDSEPA